MQNKIFHSQSSCYGIVETSTCLNDICCQCSCERCNHAVCCESNQKALDGNSSNTHDDVRQNVKIIPFLRAATKGKADEQRRKGRLLIAHNQMCWRPVCMYQLKWHRYSFSLSFSKWLCIVVHMAANKCLFCSPGFIVLILYLCDPVLQQSINISFYIYCNVCIYVYSVS